LAKGREQQEQIAATTARNPGSKLSKGKKKKKA